MNLEVRSGERRNVAKGRALWFPAAGICQMRDEPVSAPVEGQALVRTQFSGISRGTENLVFHGHVPETEFERMRSPHMGGEFPFPVKYGYSTVGRVEAGEASLIGKTVFCLHPHQDVFVVETGALTVLPEGLPSGRGVLAANMETALNIVWDAAILPGDRVAVFGAGVVGTLVAFLASQIAGTDVVLIDKVSDRLPLAGSLGLTLVSDGGAAGSEFDMLINASGASEALARAIDLAGHEARIVEASWYGDRPVSLPLGGAFHARRLTIVSSQVGSVPPSRRARWPFARRLAKALELLRDDRLDALISGETAFSELDKAYPAILADPDTLCHRIHY